MQINLALKTVDGLLMTNKISNGNFPKYDFVMYCEVYCGVYRDYGGRRVFVRFPTTRKLGIDPRSNQKMLDEWTLDVDHDS
jgi:hypothetical protein